MINFQVPDSFVTFRRKEIQRTYIYRRIDSLDELNSIGRQINHTVAHQCSLTRESLQCRPRARLLERQRSTHDKHVRIGIPSDVVQKVVLHRRAHRKLETIPVWQHVRADARSIHQADTFERNHPATEQITVRADALTNALQRVAVECVRVIGRVLHKALLVSVLAHDDRLPVDLEILVAPARELREQVFQILLRLRRGRIDEKLPFPGTRRSCSVRLHQKNAGVILYHGFVALTVWRQPNPRFESKTFYVRREPVHTTGKTIVDGGPVTVFTQTVAGALPPIVDLYVLNAKVFEVLRDPFGVELDLVFVDLLVEEVPGTPTGRRQREFSLVDGRKVFDLQCVAIIVFEDGAVFETHLVLDGIKNAVGDRRRDFAERHHHQIFVGAVANTRGDRMRPRLPY